MNTSITLKLFNAEGKPVTVGWTAKGFTLTSEVTIPIPMTKTARGRYTGGPNKPGNPAGSKRNGDGGWKLTASAVKRIRKARSTSRRPRTFCTRMAKRYNCTPAAIWSVIKGRTWKEV